MRPLLLSALLAALAPAAAHPGQSIAVVGTGTCDDPTLVSHVRAVRDALSKRLGLSVRSEADTVRPLGGMPKGTLAGASRLLGEAENDLVSDVPVSRAEYLERDKRAQQNLRKALDLLLSLSPSPERSQAMFKLKGLELQLFDGQRPELERALEAILRVLPAYAFDPNVYSPPQLERYEEVRKKVRARFTATLKVTSHPPGALIFVDGFEIGAAPVTMKVPPGEYRVEAASGPRRGMAHLVAVKDWAEVDVESDLEQSIQLESGPCVAGTTFENRSGKLARVASLLGVELVVAVRAEQASAHESYIVVEVVEAAAGPRRNGVAVKLVSGKPAPSGLDRIWDLIGDPKRPVSLAISPPDSSVLAPFPAPKPSPPPWMRPAAYGAGGLAVLFAGITAYEGISSKNSDSKANAYLQSGGTMTSADRAAYDQAIQDSDSAKKAMYVTAGTALVFAGAAAVLGYMSIEPGPPVIRF